MECRCCDCDHASDPHTEDIVSVSTMKYFVEEPFLLEDEDLHKPSAAACHLACLERPNCNFGTWLSQHTSNLGRARARVTLLRKPATPMATSSGPTTRAS